MSTLDLDQIRQSRGVDLRVWPPRYDPAYRPPPDARHWLPEVECASPEARDGLILGKLREQVRYAWERSPFYRRKWEAAGVSPGTLHTLDDLGRFPVVTKEELRAAQTKHPPFGDYLCVPPEAVARIHGTSGTTGRPTVFGIGADDWNRIGEAHARIMWALGIRPGDRVLICSFFSLYMGSWGALAGSERLGRRWPRCTGHARSGRAPSTGRRPTRFTSPKRPGGTASIPGASDFAPCSSRASRAPASRRRSV
jgi:phenylacetate-CoA ligase